MKLSKTALIFRIILPTIFGISGIVIPLILFRSQDKQEPKEELENQALYGKVISINDTALADVEIGIVGGSQVFSDSNGEFKIYCKPGQLVRFKKNGYVTHKIVATEGYFKQYLKITLNGD